MFLEKLSKYTKELFGLNGSDNDIILENNQWDELSRSYKKLLKEDPKIKESYDKIFNKIKKLLDELIEDEINLITKKKMLKKIQVNKSNLVIISEKRQDSINEIIDHNEKIFELSNSLFNTAENILIEKTSYELTKKLYNELLNNFLENENKLNNVILKIEEDLHILQPESKKYQLKEIERKNSRAMNDVVI